MDIQAARRQLEIEGFVVIPEALDTLALARLRERVALFYREWDRYPATTRKEIRAPDAEDDYLPVRELNWPSPALRLLDAEPAVAAVRRLVNELTEETSQIVHVNSLLKPAHRGAPVAPHQDVAYNTLTLDNPLTVWIPFEEASPENGGLFYLRASHKQGILAHQSAHGVHWIRETDLASAGKPQWHSFTGAPGSVGIHDSRVVHGSFPNRSRRERLALSLRFAAASPAKARRT